MPTFDRDEEDDDDDDDDDEGFPASFPSFDFLLNTTGVQSWWLIFFLIALRSMLSITCN
jgi:hypothetical protein